MPCALSQARLNVVTWDRVVALVNVNAKSEPHSNVYVLGKAQQLAHDMRHGRGGSVTASFHPTQNKSGAKPTQSYRLTVTANKDTYHIVVQFLSATATDVPTKVFPYLKSGATGEVAKYKVAVTAITR